MHKTILESKEESVSNVLRGNPDIASRNYLCWITPLHSHPRNTKQVRYNFVGAIDSLYISVLRYNSCVA